MQYLQLTLTGMYVLNYIWLSQQFGFTELGRSKVLLRVVVVVVVVVVEVFI